MTKIEHLFQTKCPICGRTIKEWKKEKQEYLEQEKSKEPMVYYSEVRSGKCKCGFEYFYHVPTSKRPLNWSVS